MNDEGRVTGGDSGDEVAPVAEAIGVSRRYGGVLALDNMDFSVGQGEVRALLGANGAGKSTLIRMLSGADRPDSGQVRIGGVPLAGRGVRAASQHGVAVVYQELSSIPSLSVAENLFLGSWPMRHGIINSKKMRDDATAVLSRLGSSLDPNIEVQSLSLAERQIVEIARAIRERPRLLILDEPTSALPADEVTSVLEVIRRISQTGVSVIYVSHRMDEIQRIADTVTVMRDGHHVKTMRVVDTTTEEIAQLMLGDGVRTALDAVPVGPESLVGNVVLAVDHLRVPPKVADVSLELHRGEVLGLAGLLGSGRTELLHALAGFHTAATGGISVNGVDVRHPTPRRMRELGIGLTPEDRKMEGIVPEFGIDENIVMSSYEKVSQRRVVLARLTARAAGRIRQRLSIKAVDLSEPITTLSGGSQQKVVIGRWLHAGSQILLLDEPTRGVDIETKTQIYGIVRELAKEGAAVIYVSSEIEELPRVCDRVLVIRSGRIVSEYRAPDIDLAGLMSATMATAD